MVSLADGVWISIPVIAGSLPLDEAMVLIGMYYEELWVLFQSFIHALANINFEWDCISIWI